MSKHKNKKALIITVATALLISGGLFAFTLAKRNSNNLNTDTKNGIIYESPTEEEQKAGDQQKQAIAEKDKSIANQTRGLKQAEVIITDAGQYQDSIEVRSFVSNVYENGTCQTTFTNGDKTVIRDSPAYKDATTTQCTNPMILRSEFPTGGDWYVKVRFTSVSSSWRI